MKTPINIREIKIRAFKAETNDALMYTDAVFFQGVAEVTSIIGKNTQDGMQNIQYIADVKTVEVGKSQYETESPRVITPEQTVSRKSRSKSIRDRAFVIAKKHGDSAEELYNRAMDAADDWLTNYDEEMMGL